MSCIIAYSENGVVWMGCDSRWCIRDNVGSFRTDEIPKVFFKDGFLFGGSGSRRVMELLRWTFNLPPFQPDGDILKYLSSDFANSFMEFLKHYNCVDIKDGDALIYPFLIGRGGKIFHLKADFSISVSPRKFDACGSAEDLALCVLEALESYPMTAEQRILRALEVCAEFNSTVGKPFYVFSEVNHG